MRRYESRRPQIVCLLHPPFRRPFSSVFIVPFLFFSALLLFLSVLPQHPRPLLQRPRLVVFGVLVVACSVPMSVPDDVIV